jgi:protoporphyrinogen oxidase
MIKTNTLIIGAGPTGLSVAYLLKNKGIKDFIIVEKNNRTGGLSKSFKDELGFTWDLGGHVVHDKNKNFVSFTKTLLKENIIKQQRKANIFFKNSFVPYPFQNNIAFLPNKYKTTFLKDLKQLKNQQQNTNIKTFKDWISHNFGAQLSKHFMIPQNQKSWQFPLKQMGTMWLNKKISKPPLKQIAQECKKNNPDVLNWGTHQNFYYPKHGGIGQLWQNTAKQLKTKVQLNTKIDRIKAEPKTAITNSGTKIQYKQLITTIPLPKLAEILEPQLKIKNYTNQLKKNSGLIIGFGFNKQPANNNWHWMYFPEKKYPFFRLCQLSKFSPYNVPNSSYSSILAEISWRKKKPHLEKTFNKVKKQITNILYKDNKVKTISSFVKFTPYYYPIPTINRDQHLKKIDNLLKNKDIYSLGRFGSWKYEKGNMDGCFKQSKKIIQTLF